MAMFGFAACELEMDGMPIRTDAEVTLAQRTYALSEAARRVDVLESVLESVRCALSSSDVELHYRAIHGLWELTCPCNGCCHATRYINWSSRSLSRSFGRTGRTHGESESAAPADSTEALPAESSQTCGDGGCATFSPTDAVELPADAAPSALRTNATALPSHNASMRSASMLTK